MILRMRMSSKIMTTSKIKTTSKNVEKMKHILGYKIKIVERSGIPIKLIIPLSKVGEG